MGAALALVILSVHPQSTLSPRVLCVKIPLRAAAAAVQVRSIIGQVRPDRQTLLFSATMPNKVDRLVQDALTSPVRVTVGEIGAANDDIRQVRNTWSL